jgi:3-hydroxy-3-methylglutaryl CoA synthase
MATAMITREDQFLNTVAAEIVSGVESVVECWMAQIDEVYHDTQLTTFGRMNAIRSIVDKYKQQTGKDRLQCRRT